MIVLDIGLPVLPPPEPAVLTACNPPNVDFLGLSFLALLVSSFYILFFYFWGKLTSNPNTDVWVKGELYEIGATVFIVLVFLPIFLNVACAFKLGDYNIFETAHLYLESLKASITAVMDVLALGYAAVDMIASVSIKASPFGLGLSANDVGAGVIALWKPIILQMTNALTLGYIFASAQTVILEYFTYGMVTKILPLGILLRSFTPTRKVGGMLLGLSLGLLFLYPLILTLNYLLVKDYLVVSWDEKSHGWKLDESFRSVGSDILNAAIPMDPDASFWENFFKIAGEVVSIVGSIAFAITTGLGFVILAWVIITALWGAIISGAYLGIVAGIILPALNTVILIQGIRYFTYLFGEELDITTLTRMV
ncbi:MAG: hypothetical protein ACPL06_00780 [Candidatus Anstonellales archaeon]